MLETHFLYSTSDFHLTWDIFVVVSFISLAINKTKNYLPSFYGIINYQTLYYQSLCYHKLTHIGSMTPTPEKKVREKTSVQNKSIGKL